MTLLQNQLARENDLKEYRNPDSIQTSLMCNRTLSDRRLMTQDFIFIQSCMQIKLAFSYIGSDYWNLVAWRGKAWIIQNHGNPESLDNELVKHLQNYWRGFLSQSSFRVSRLSFSTSKIFSAGNKVSLFFSASIFCTSPLTTRMSSTPNLTLKEKLLHFFSGESSYPYTYQKKTFYLGSHSHFVHFCQEFFTL